MAFVAVGEEIQRRLLSASPDETAEQLAEELGVSPATVRRYRKAARNERAEAAREVIVRRVEQATPNAMATLEACVRIATEKMEETSDPEYIREARSSAKVLLDYLGVAPERDPLETETDDALLGVLAERGIVVR